MNIRPATAGDRDGVITLARRFHQASSYGSLLTVRQELVGVLFDLALEHGVIFVGEMPLTGLVGFLGLVVLDHTLSGDRYAEEVAWWVEPAYRTGMLGPRLLRQAEGWAASHECVFLKMSAPAGTDVGVFYARQGYVPIETAYMKRLTAGQEG